ncbi:hypothetical protein V9T40_008059 [Parthenolecanium corni]|uniref:PXA domain-containing protein n=1 Tax=Parthenolecanium corni TaxID=536013 RepID=A0AAN9TTF2_9HEMI
MALGLFDYAIFGLTLIISVIIGLYARFTGGKQKTNEEYLLGGKDQNVIPIAISLVASFASSISILGYTSEVYRFGTHFFGINVAYMFSTPIAAIFYLPVLFKNNTVSVYEYLEKRFGRPTRLLASLAFTVQMILYMGIVHYAPALAVEAVTGIPQIWSIIMVGVICIFYSTVGGIKAVIITDVFQTGLMFAAVIAIIVVNIIDAGSFSEILRVADAGERIQFSNFNPDPTERHSWWTVIIGGFFTHIAIYAINQAQVQRFVSMKSYKLAAWALMCSLPILIAFMTSLCIAGLCLYYYYRNCDPISEGRIQSADQLVPLYVMDRLDAVPGLTGLFVAGIFSASLSTVSAAVNSLAAVTLEDFLKPFHLWYREKELLDSNARISKALALIYGFICLGVALLIRNYESLLTTCLVVFGIIGGPLFAVFTAGIMIPLANQFGVIIGFIIGILFSFYIGFGGPKPKPFPLPVSTTGCLNSFTSVIQSAVAKNITEGNISSLSKHVSSNDDYAYIFRISYLYYIVLGFLITLVLSILLSLIKSDPNSSNNPDLFTPLVANYLRKRLIKEERVYMVLKLMKKSKKKCNFDNRLTGSNIIDEELQLILYYVFRDFVYPWYSKVSDDQEFPYHLKEAAQKIIIAVANR